MEKSWKAVAKARNTEQGISWWNITHPDRVRVGDVAYAEAQRINELVDQMLQNGSTDNAQAASDAIMESSEFSRDEYESTQKLEAFKLQRPDIVKLVHENKFSAVWAILRKEQLWGVEPRRLVSDQIGTLYQTGNLQPLLDDIDADLASSYALVSSTQNAFLWLINLVPAGALSGLSQASKAKAVNWLGYLSSLEYDEDIVFGSTETNGYQLAHVGIISEQSVPKTDYISWRGVHHPYN